MGVLHCTTLNTHGAWRMIKLWSCLKQTLTERQTVGGRGNDIWKGSHKCTGKQTDKILEIQLYTHTHMHMYVCSWTHTHTQSLSLSLSYTHTHTHTKPVNLGMHPHCSLYATFPSKDLLFQRWKWRKIKKAWKCGSGGHRRPVVGSRGNAPVRGHGAKPPETQTEVFFPKSKLNDKPHFLALHLVSNSHSKNTLYCALRHSSRGTNKTMPSVGIKGWRPLKLEIFFFFFNLRYENPQFLVLYPVSNSHSHNTLYCALRFSSRGTNQA